MRRFNLSSLVRRAVPAQRGTRVGCMQETSKFDPNFSLPDQSACVSQEVITLLANLVLVRHHYISLIKLTLRTILHKCHTTLIVHGLLLPCFFDCKNSDRSFHSLKQSPFRQLIWRNGRIGTYIYSQIIQFTKMSYKFDIFSGYIPFFRRVLRAVFTLLSPSAGCYSSSTIVYNFTRRFTP